MTPDSTSDAAARRPSSCSSHAAAAVSAGLADKEGVLLLRFLDTAALERDFARKVVELNAGDMVIFDSGRHVHRVSPVVGARPRVTLGGFLTADVARSRVAYWS